jgi:hypothetical protein
MAIRNWHGGKILLLWVWGIVVSGVVLKILEGTRDFVRGFILIGAIIVIPMILSVITWKWLSGKEH